jgi:hypothetical protein
MAVCRSGGRAQRSAAIEAVVTDVQARGGALTRWTDDPGAADHVVAVMADREANELCLT